jgi:hypothetical protein
VTVSYPVRIAFIIVCALLVGPGLHAAERIVGFDSDITVNTDASLLVTETIEIEAEGREIKRGIYRDFPTTYADRLGNRVRVRLHVLEVRRNDTPEPYQLDSLADGVRIRIGRADRPLEAGRYRYAITYRTERQLGFFDDYDELYWNVTGNAWAFPIERARARVTLPAGARPSQESAYTGRTGAKGKDYRRSEQGGVWRWETTRTLAPGEGLTIAVAWPKGFVTEPGGVRRLGWFLRDNAATGVALGGTVLVLLYYLLAWRRFGKDPDKGTIIPRFKPPDGLSPAATRFIRLMSFDNKAFSAALIDMAVRGYLVIEEEAKSYRLSKAPGAVIEPLSNGERRIAGKLFGSRDSILLDKRHHKLLSQSVRNFRNSLEAEFERACFVRNTLFFSLGLGLSVAMILLTALVAGDRINVFSGFVVALFSAAVTFLFLYLWGDDSDPTFKAIPFRSLPVRGGMATVLKFGLFFVVVGVSSFSAIQLQVTAHPLQTVAFALLGGLNIIFFFLLKRPTLAGRAVMDEIEGFRMYLKVAEEERLNLLHPPEKTPALFEKYLPYALALDVENEWSGKFTRLLAAASVAPDDAGYRPRWYRGGSWRPGRTGLFSKGLGASLGSAVASSVAAPGSRSGSGGGGSSGGGGGGGGGGGW